MQKGGNEVKILVLAFLLIGVVFFYSKLSSDDPSLTGELFYVNKNAILKAHDGTVYRIFIEQAFKTKDPSGIYGETCALDFLHTPFLNPLKPQILNAQQFPQRKLDPSASGLVEVRPSCVDSSTFRRGVCSSFDDITTIGGRIVPKGYGLIVNGQCPTGTYCSEGVCVLNDEAKEGFISTSLSPGPNTNSAEVLCVHNNGDTLLMIEHSAYPWTAGSYDPVTKWFATVYLDRSDGDEIEYQLFDSKCNRLEEEEIFVDSTIHVTAMHLSSSGRITGYSHNAHCGTGDECIPTNDEIIFSFQVFEVEETLFTQTINTGSSYFSDMVVIDGVVYFFVDNGDIYEFNSETHQITRHQNLFVPNAFYDASYDGENIWMAIGGSLKVYSNVHAPPNEWNYLGDKRSELTGFPLKISSLEDGHTVVFTSGAADSLTTFNGLNKVANTVVPVINGGEFRNIAISPTNHNVWYLSGILTEGGKVDVFDFSLQPLDVINIPHYYNTRGIFAIPI